MGIDKITVAGALLALVAITFFALVAIQQPYPTFKYATQSGYYVSVTQAIGPEDSRFMWSTRSLDLMVQAFVLFAAAAATLAMLRTEKKRKIE